MKLWITRDVDSYAIYAWKVQPNYSDGRWDIVVATCPYSVHVSFATALLGDQWREHGQFCCEIEVASVKRVRTRPEGIVKELRGMAKDGRYATVIIEAADLIESLIQK